MGNKVPLSFQTITSYPLLQVGTPKDAQAALNSKSQVSYIYIHNTSNLIYFLKHTSKCSLFHAAHIT